MIDAFHYDQAMRTDHQGEVPALSGVSPTQNQNKATAKSTMLQHADVWRGIDRLAAKYGFSASGLARRAGLDPTAFNPSKRITREGRPRWPSTESVAKVLSVTGETFADFVALTGAAGSPEASDGAHANGGRQQARILPVIDLEQAALGACFDAEGRPTGSAWGRFNFGAAGEHDLYAIEISGHDLDPVYRDGDVVVVAPGAELRHGDRVVVAGPSGLMLRQFGRRDADGIYLETLAAGGAPQQFIPNDQLRWIARISWVTQ